MIRKAIVFALLLGVLSTGACATTATDPLFPNVQEFAGYTDVDDQIWYASAARVCYETGLITGTATGVFSPDGTLDIAQLATISARIREAVTGNPIPGQPENTVWYTPYVQYLQNAGISIQEPERLAQRQDFISLLAAVVPLETLTPLQSIEALPDSSDTDVLTFYSAGILTGVDSFGTFAPEKTLSRAEAAVMLARIVRPELRVSFILEDSSAFRAAQVSPGDLFFSNGVTAEQFLKQVNTVLTACEARLQTADIEFNWHLVEDNGETLLTNVKTQVLSQLGVSADLGTESYQNFDYQVYYSRLIDQIGGPL